MSVEGVLAGEGKWWPRDVFWITDAPQDVAIAEKMEKGKVHFGKFTPPETAIKPWKIGCLIPDLTDPWWVAYIYGFVSECERLNIWATILNAGGYEHLSKQINQMEDLIAQGINIIVLNPISFDAQTEIIKEAKKKGIQVIASANDIRTDEVLTRVEISYWTMGNQAGKFVIEDAKKKGLKKVQAVYLAGPAGAGWTVGQVEGFKAAIKKAPMPVELVDVKWGEMEKGVQTTLAEDALTTYGKNLNYMIGDSLCMSAAVAPLEQRNMIGKVGLVATATTEEAFEYMKEGKMITMGTSYPVLLGAMSVNVAVAYLNGDALVRNILKWPDVIGTIPYFVTKNNMKDFEKTTAFAPKGWTPVFNVRPK